MSDIIVERGDPDEAQDLYKARQVGETLEKHYPGHPWVVSFQGRVLVVRHYEINEFVKRNLGRDGFGFVLHHLKSYSATQLAHDAMIAGGQMLEAFGIPRGAWRGAEPMLPPGFEYKRPETFQ
jgi:hypothetical protein